MDKKYSYEELLEIIATLRSENGCPWDREQTHESLKEHLVEECYELVEAIEKADEQLMQEELGDVLLQLVMHAQIAKEEGRFSMEEVVDGIAKKMVHRHPHVFKKEGQNTDDLLEVKSANEVLSNWEKIKAKEKSEKSIVESMERVAKTLPALMRAQKIQKNAMKLSEETYHPDEQIDTIINMLNALKYEDLQQNNKEIASKIEKIMFEVVNLSTFFDINAEFTLTKSGEKFINRFRYIENSRFDKH